jgi:ribosomal protein S18 acetylase RimI-like enzyme
MPEVALRPTRADDLAFVMELERQPDNRDFIGQWSDAEHLAAIARENGREHWVIESEGERAGFLIAYDCRAHDAGFYVKRLLVADKERGLGTAALRQFLARVRPVEGVSCVWLIVRHWNTRAQKVYANLGFKRFDPAPEELPRYDAAAEAPRDPDFRMRLAP